jgi:hypothetical protein
MGAVQLTGGGRRGLCGDLFAGVFAKDGQAGRGRQLTAKKRLALEVNNCAIIS